MSEDNRGLSFLSVAAIIIAVLALAVGAVLPSTGDIMFNELYGVNITDPLNGQVLKYDVVSGNWINLNETQTTIPTYSFSNLTDSGITNPSINQTLIYNGSQWINHTPNTYVNTSYGWDDLNFPALSLAKSANLAPNQGVILGSGGIEGLLFNGVNQVNEVFGAGEILHSYRQGSDLYPHVHWMATTAGAGNVTWFLEYSIDNINVAYRAPTTISISQATTGTAWVHRLAEFSAINGTGLTIGSQITFRLYRNATAPTDTYTDNVNLISFGIHYHMDSAGSTSIASK